VLAAERPTTPGVAGIDWRRISLQDHGSAAIAACRAEQPAVYLKVIASLLPKDVTLTTRNFDDLSDDQLMRKLALVTEMAKPLLAKLPTLIDVTVGTPVEPRADVGAQASNDINILATDDN
jgi:hypothetical protein